MNTNLLAIVNRIVAEQGEGILADKKRLNPFSPITQNQHGSNYINGNAGVTVANFFVKELKMKKNNILVMILALVFCMALGISPVYSQNAVDHYNQRFANLDKSDYNRVTVTMKLRCALTRIMPLPRMILRKPVNYGVINILENKVRFLRMYKPPLAASYNLIPCTRAPKERMREHWFFYTSFLGGLYG
jgi:hypothetical protein